MPYIKSPFNYQGNKYRQLTQLCKIFPQNINNFIDLFTGGGDLAINTPANHIYANDINTFIIDIMREFQTKPVQEILGFMDSRIKEFDLSKTNESGYNQYRDLYNTNESYHTPLDLFTLSRFSFNNLIRFNKDLELNIAFGRNRSSFNPTQRKNTIAFCEKIKTVTLSSNDFRTFDLSNYNQDDFLYIDPPYLISGAVYNANAREAEQKWEQKDDDDLYKYLDEANNHKIKWAMSNMIKHKGKINQSLVDWIKDNNYNIFNINSNYSYCSYNAIMTEDPTIEVVITNYEKE